MESSSSGCFLQLVLCIGQLKSLASAELAAGVLAMSGEVVLCMTG